MALWATYILSPRWYVLSSRDNGSGRKRVTAVLALLSHKRQRWLFCINIRWQWYHRVLERQKLHAGATEPSL